jgi:hypothetical protein
MQGIRRRVTRFACLWVAFQLSVWAAAPIAVGCAHGTATEAELPECCTLHGPGVMCPMQRTTDEPTERADHDEISMREVCCVCDAALASLLGPSATLTKPVAPARLLVSTEHFFSAIGSPLDSISVPEAPPPRT